MPETNPTQAPDAPAAEAPASTPDSGEPTWFDALTGRAPVDAASAEGEEPADGDAEQPESGAQGSESTEQTPSQPQQPQPQPKKDSPGPDDVVRLTRTQLEREIQSRADKLIAKQAREAQKRAQEQELERKAREDPYAFSDEFLQQREQERKLNEESQGVHQLIAATSAQFDRATVDPVVHSLPPAIQQKLIQEIQPVGVEGRAKLVTAALDEVRKLARTEGEQAAEAKLRKSAAFRKELLAELRGSEDEPELLPAGGRSPQPTDMDDWIRMAANAGRI